MDQSLFLFWMKIEKNGFGIYNLLKFSWQNKIDSTKLKVTMCHCHLINAFSETQFNFLKIGLFSTVT